MHGGCMCERPADVHQRVAAREALDLVHVEGPVGEAVLEQPGQRRRVAVPQRQQRHLPRPLHHARGQLRVLRGHRRDLAHGGLLHGGVVHPLLHADRLGLRGVLQRLVQHLLVRAAPVHHAAAQQLDHPEQSVGLLLLVLILELLAQVFEGLDRLLQRRVGAARLDHVERVELLDLQRRRDRALEQASRRPRQRRRPTRHRRRLRRQLRKRRRLPRGRWLLALLVQPVQDEGRSRTCHDHGRSALSRRGADAHRHRPQSMHVHGTPGCWRRALRPLRSCVRCACAVAQVASADTT